MANQNTQNRLVAGTLPGQIATLSGIGTTETAFSINGNAAVGSSASVAVLGLLDPDQFVNGQSFKVRLQGVVTTGTTSTVAVNLYQGSSATLGSDTKIVGPTAVSIVSATSQFWMDVTLSYDSVSQTLNGHYISRIAGTAAGPTATTAATSITSASLLSFVPSAVFSVSNAGNSIKLVEFSIEAV
jgi:hypothetical protein